MSLYIDLNLVCVICLQDGELRSVFEQDDGGEMKISDKIMKCTELSIVEDNKLPDKICNRCVEDLEATYRFLQNCEAANAMFRSIQQEEDAQATFELQQQRIKIPSGLKIKRIKPQGTTYLMTVPVDQMPQPIPVAGDNEEAVLTVPVAEGESDQASPEGETMDLDDYYEAEEVLNDDSDDEIVEIKVEKQISESTEIDAPATPNVPKQENSQDLPEPKLEVITAKIEVKKEEYEVAGENMPPEAQFLTTRGRGRPRKVKGSDAAISQEITDVNSGILKPIIGRPRGRKRHSLSPDSKPTKICDICGNSYKYQHALNAHMRRHNNVRPFNCEFCEKAFVSAVELRRHMRVHTGQKPYACQYCDRRFSDFGSRIKHERTHTGERPYTCTTCGKAFAYPHVLSVHMRTHTGEKKFKCNLCGKGFTKKIYVEAHVEQHLRVAKVAAVNSTMPAEECERGEMVAIRDVALEECIFTTEYIGNDDDDDDDDETVTTVSVIHMNEEHLEGNEDTVGSSCDEVEVITGDFPSLAYQKHVQAGEGQVRMHGAET